MKGDVFNRSKGDVFNSAKGDVFRAMGDVFNSAKGDAFNSANPLFGKSEAEVDAIYSTKPFDDDYYEWLDYDPSLQGSADDSKVGFWGTVFNIVELGDKTADVVNKFKGGSTSEMDAVDLDIDPRFGDAPKKSNAIWYVAGGVALLLGIVAFVAITKKK